MKIGYAHALESGTVAVTSSDALYPSLRLYDRIFGRPWKATSTATQTIHVDAGAGGIEINALIIPASHNLNGCTLSWQYSSNDSSWSNAVTGWTQSGSGIIVKEMVAAQTMRYWRFVISGASAIPYCHEVFMTYLNAFSDPLLGGGKQKDRVVIRTLSYSGIPHLVKCGTSKHEFRGSYYPLDTTEQTAFQTFLDSWDGYKPFYIEDAYGYQYFAEFTSDPERTDEGAETARWKFDVRQVN